MILPLSSIDVRAGTQTRATLDTEHIDEYCELYRAKTELPPLDVFKIDGRHVLADGFHRYYGAKKFGLDKLDCAVHPGGRDDCMSFALRSNVKHGMRRTNADKRRAVELAVREWPKSSARAIAELCFVEHHLVTDVMATMDANKEHEPRPKNPNKTEPVGESPTEQLSSSSSKTNGKTQEKPEKPQVCLDDTGTPIPEDALPFWRRKQEVQDILTQLIKLKGIISDAKTSGDPLYAKVSQATIDHLSQAYTHFSEAKPYAVCTQCMGSPSLQPKGCSLCGNSGMISKYKWDTVSRAEVKTMRAKSNALRA